MGNATAEVDVSPRRSLWHHRDFRRLWIGESVSEFGTTISRLALPLLAILTLHATTLQVGLLATCEWLPFLAVGLPAGALVDRMRRRAVLISNDVMRAAAIASVPLAAGLHDLTIAQLYAVVLVVGASTVFFDVAYQSYLPELVERDDLVEGNAKLTGSESVAQVVGPGLGGALVQALTAPYALLVDAASYLWSAAWVSAIRQRTSKPARHPDRHLGREIMAGLRFVVGHPLLRPIATCTATANLFTSLGLAVYYVLLARVLHLSPGLIGAISSIGAMGGLLGSVLARRVAGAVGQGPAMWISALASAPMMYVTPFVLRDWTLGLLAAAQLGTWVAFVVYNITQVSFRQALCPPELLGRVNATMRFLVWGTLPLGSLIGGLLGSSIGVRATLLVAAIGGSFAFVPVFLSPLRTMKQLPTYQDAQPSS